jgi:hypothetical protein
MEFDNNLSPSELASRFINHSNLNVFLTGKAGTGKTTFLKHIIKITHKKALIVAPTGIAAINAGGVTIHSLFQLPFGTFVPTESVAENASLQLKINTPASISKGFQMASSKRKLLRELELLIIDEVSMLRADLLDAIDARLKYIRRKSDLPFGGVQVLFIGDLLQLPPVVKNEEWDILRPHYKSAFFFDAQALQNHKPLYIELDKIYRQSDDRFIALLNNLRNNTVTQENILLLNNYYNPNLKIDTKLNYIYLTTHNLKANELNSKLLSEINSPSKKFEAQIKGEFSEFSYPASAILELKKGAQVMFVKNDASGMHLYFNGKIGIVTGFMKNPDGDELIGVLCDGNEKSIYVNKNEWQNIKYVLNTATNEIEEKIEGKFIQYPLKLAWAITVHKSQGLTFEKAIIDIGNAFAPGQVYVALSRLKSLDGLILTSKINYAGMKSDDHVNEYAKTKEDQENLILLEEKESTNYLKSYLTASFDMNGLYKIYIDHAGTYHSNEKKSLKWQNKGWIDSPIIEIQKIKLHADNFISQVKGILQKCEKNYMRHLNERLIAAEKYFGDALKNISDKTLSHVSKINQEKRSKEYLDELLELDTEVFEKQKRIKKCVVLANALSNRKEFTKQDLKEIVNDTLREARVKDALTKKQTELGIKKVKKTTIAENVGFDTEEKYIDSENNSHTSNLKLQKKTRKEEAENEALRIINNSTNNVPNKKLSTKEMSFYLFLAGKKIEDIAAIRKVSIGTISSHLISYVANGIIDPTKIYKKKKLEIIIEEVKKAGLQNLTELKENLGDGYTYDEIRFAISWLSFLEGHSK